MVPYLRSCLFLSGVLALASCASPESGVSSETSPPPPLPQGPAQPAAGTGKAAGNVLLLVPLSGPLSAVGQVLANAAKLAIPSGHSPSLDIRDTQGTPQGAAHAAAAGLAAGDGIIIGPLTAEDTQAVIPIAKQNDVNMLSFTNDGALASPGVWPLGITPTQQVERVVQLASAAGHTQLAGLLPASDFGHRLADALRQEATSLNEPSPDITFYTPGFQNINIAVQQLTGASASTKTPPQFNALFVGATDPNTLAEIANFLPYYGIFPQQVQLMGPTLWSNLATAMAGQTSFIGALYAAPDPAGASAFQTKYQGTYGSMPPGIANLAFDAAALASLAASSGGYTDQTLTAPAGFTGTDGVLVLQADGTVKRGLAAFAVEPGQPRLVSPSPTSFKHN